MPNLTSSTSLSKAPEKRGQEWEMPAAKQSTGGLSLVNIFAAVRNPPRPTYPALEAVQSALAETAAALEATAAAHDETTDACKDHTNTMESMMEGTGGHTRIPAAQTSISICCSEGGIGKNGTHTSCS